MEQTANPKSRLLRRATIGFFAGMAVLTLFSNTIVNYSLPRVQVKNFESGMMFRQIQAEGTIAAQLQHTVNFGAPRIVDQVKVDVGSPVLVGDVIATLKPTDGVELLEMEKALENAELELARMKRTPANLSVPAMEKAVKEAIKDVERQQKTIAEKEKAIEDAKEALWEIVEDKEDAVDAAEDQLKIAEAALADARKALEDAEEDGTNLEAIETAKVNVKNAENNVENKEEAVEDAEDDLEEAEKIAENPDNQESVILAKEALGVEQELLIEKNEFVNQAKMNLAEAKKTDALAVKDRQTAITKAENDLSVQRAKFEQFKSTQGVNEIKADYEGRISKLALSAGATINTAEAVAVIDDAQARYDLKATIPADQAKSLVIGDRADVSMGSVGWAQAILREIREDKDQPGVVKQLVFDVEGEVALGQQVSINIYKQGRNYDMIVPNAAIRQDASGSFVLAMRQKNGPLGSRYTLERVSVTVLESDSTRSAISGALDWGMPIVTAANKPVEAGSRVLPTK